MKWSAAVGLALLLFTVSACDELDLQGRLGNCEFVYQCGAGDPGCEGEDAIFGFDLDREFLTIAVGGSFGLQTDDASLDIDAVAPSFVSKSGDRFVFDRPGTVDFVASDGGIVLDFVDVTAAVPTGVTIFYDGGPATAIGDTSARYELAAAPRANNEVLAGGFVYTWSSSGGVNLVAVGGNGVEATGSGTVTVTSNGFTASVTLP